VTVRDPPAASRRWTRWNSGTDGESPEERQRAGGCSAVLTPVRVPGVP
jgi:hypothetical protein